MKTELQKMKRKALTIGEFQNRVNTLDLMVNPKEDKRLQNPFVQGVADYVVGSHWDRYTAAQGVVLPTEINFFTVPINQNGKTKVDTSMTMAGQLSAPKWINVTSLIVYFGDNMKKEDISLIMNNAYLEFWVMDKIYSQGLLWMYPAPGGIYAASQFYSPAAGYAAQPTRETVYSNGVPAIGNEFDLRLPAGMTIGQNSDGTPQITDGVLGVQINAGEDFKVVVRFGSPQTLGAADGLYGGCSITIALRGVVSRQVQ